jgi:hypothetical protein
VVPVLRSLLADPDPDVRIFVVNILDSERHPEVESWLIEVIETRSHVNVCATAVDLLCEVGTEAAIDRLPGSRPFSFRTLHPVCRRPGAETHSWGLTLS